MAKTYRILVLLLLTPLVDYKHDARGSKEDYGGDNACKDAGATGKGQLACALYVLYGVEGRVVIGTVRSVVYKVQRSRRGCDLFLLSAS